jgi:outer membrane protein
MRRNHVSTMLSKLLLAAMPAGASLFSQNLPITLNLASVAKLAETDSLVIRASQQDVVSAGKRLQQARALRFGKLETTAQYLRFSDPILITTPAVTVAALGNISLAVPPTMLSPQDNAHVRMQAGVPIFTGGKIPNTIRKARESTRAAESVHDETRMSGIFQAERLYLGSLLTREVVRLNEQALQSYEKHLGDARVALQAGVVATYDLIRAETAVKEQEKRLTEARNQYDLTEAALRTTLAMTPDAPIVVEGSLFDAVEPLTLPAAQQLAIKSNPALAALSHKVEALRHAERVEQGSYFPSITAVAGKEMITSKIAQTDPHWYAGVQADLTLFEGGARRARVAEKASEVAKARIELQHASDEVLLAIRSAFLDLNSQRSALESARKSEELSLESLRLASKRFSVGTGTSLEVLDANVALTSARIGVQSALYRIDVAYLQTHRYVGDIDRIASR